MTKFPRFRPHFRVHIPDSDHLVMVSEDRETRLTGAFYARLAPYVDGKHSVDEITSELPEDDTADEIRQALAILEERGYVTYSDPTEARERIRSRPRRPW